MNKNLLEIKHLPQTEEFGNRYDLTYWLGNIVKGNKKYANDKDLSIFSQKLVF